MLSPEVQQLNQCLNFYKVELKEYDSLRYRSDAEIAIAKSFDKHNYQEVLDSQKVYYLPNCIINTPELRHDKSTYKMESDFLVFHFRDIGILEVDGDHHKNPDTTAKDVRKEELYKKMGIKVVERFDAKLCYSQPDSVVKNFLTRMSLVYCNADDIWDIGLPWYRILAKYFLLESPKYWTWDKFCLQMKKYMPLYFDGYTFKVAVSTNSHYFCGNTGRLKEAGFQVFGLDFNFEVTHIASSLCKDYQKGMKSFRENPSVKRCIIEDNPTWGT